MENERDTVAISALKEDLQDVLIEYQVSIQKAGTTVGPLKFVFFGQMAQQQAVCDQNFRQMASHRVGSLKLQPTESFPRTMVRLCASALCLYSVLTDSHIMQPTCLG